MDKGKAFVEVDGDEMSPIATFDLSELVEPKTILHEDLKRAREAALYVLRNFSHEEAAKIFLQGWNAAEMARKVDKTSKPNVMLNLG